MIFILSFLFLIAVLLYLAMAHVDVFFALIKNTEIANFIVSNRIIADGVAAAVAGFSSMMSLYALLNMRNSDFMIGNKMSFLVVAVLGGVALIFLGGQVIVRVLALT